MMLTARKPLTGKKILVTRASEQAAGLSRKLQNLGATTIEIPTIEIAPPSNTDNLDNSISNLEDYDWIIFTSVHGVEFFLQRINALQTNVSVLDNVKIATIGSATSAALERAGRKPDYTPDEFLSEQIAAGLGNLRGKRILLPRANIASKRLPILLRERGATVDEVTAYRTVYPRELNAEELTKTVNAGIDIVTFTSPSTVNNFAQALGDKRGKVLSNLKVACIGPVTSEAARKAGISPKIVAKQHTIDALVEAIVDEIRNHSRQS